MLPDSEPDEKDKPKDKPKLKPNMCSDCSEAMRMSELPVYFREAGEPDRILHPGCFAKSVLPKKRKLYPRALLVFCRACSVTSISFNGKTCSACQSNRVNSVS